MLTLHFSAWWMIGITLVLLWIWALTRKGEPGGYFPDPTPVLAVLFALVVTIAFAVGAGVTLLLT